MIARWDLARNSASFDFFSWLVTAAAKGAREIVFGDADVRIKRWSEEVSRQRFRSIVVPGPALVGLSYRFGDDGKEKYSQRLDNLVKFHNSGHSFPRLHSPLPARPVKYTVTLRRSPHNEFRNSNEPAWREFAQDIGAIVIEDYDVEPMHLHDRMAFYAGAEMNFGVVTGPMHLCVLSRYPWMMFNCNKEAATYEWCGIKAGKNYPWAGKNQIAVWEDDDLPNLRKHFDEWNNMKG